jgi:hypothetical protein
VIAQHLFELPIYRRGVVQRRTTTLLTSQPIVDKGNEHNVADVAEGGRAHGGDGYRAHDDGGKNECRREIYTRLIFDC